MTKFKDCKDREWGLNLTFGHMEPLRKEAGLDLANPTDERVWAVLYTDPTSLVNALWVLVQKQAASKEDFFEGLDADALDRASAAMLEELLVFIHRRQSATVRAQMPKLLAAFSKAQETDMNAALRNLSGDSPESSALTPTG